MKILSIMFVLLIASNSFANGFDVKASGTQTFNFKDGKNQAMFFSSTPIEDITGMTSDINGIASFDIENFAETLEGDISISVASLKTGIESRDGHLQGEGWLNAEKYPNVTFKIKSVESSENVEVNKIRAKILGDFTVHGVTREETADVTATYLDESEQTKMRAPGDLLGVVGNFSIKLSDYGVNNKILGQKVSDNIEIKITMVGSNKK
jgi:polyisoprenoid-binding protein YceI